MPKTKRKDKKNKKRYIRGGALTQGEMLQQEGIDRTTTKGEYLSIDNSPGFLNFEERYAHMPGSEGGYSGKEYRKFKDLEDQGIPVDSDRYDYLKTVHDERTRATGTTALNVGGLVLGAYTGNTNLMATSASNIGAYAMGEMEETKAGGQNPYTGEYLGSDPTGQEIQFEEELIAQIAPMLSSIGQGTGFGAESQLPVGANIESDYTPNSGVISVLDIGETNYAKQGSKLRYIPRKYDYIKGNTFGKQ